MTDLYLQFIDEMSHEERSIFLYRYILKLSNHETAKRLKMPIREVILLADLLKPELVNCKKTVFEAFGV